MMIQTNKTIDCKGLACPMPIVKTKKAVDEMLPGHVLEVVATDPGSVADLKAWAERTGNQFVGTVEEGGVYKHYIRKCDPNEGKTETKHPHTVTHDELLAVLGDNPVILDVREPAEYAFGHIPGAQSVVFGELQAKLDELKVHAEREVFVVCRTGNRSDLACQVLAENGFGHVKNVLPGMSAWNGPLEK